MKVVGIDVSRGKANVCILEEIPADLLEFARSYKPIVVSIANAEDLLALGDVFVMEPTGSDHKLFVEVLEKHHRPVLGVTGMRIRNFARDSGILNKSDREDAAVIAAYGVRHLSQRNIKAFISCKSTSLKEHYLALQAIRKQRVALIGQLRARLCYEVPELHDRKIAVRVWGDKNPPRLWRVLAKESGLIDWGVTLPEETVGRGLSSLSSNIATQICSLERLEHEMECEVDQIIEAPCFAPYRKVFDEWNIADTTRLAILGTIYPIEQFLGDNGEIVRKRVHAGDSSKHNRTVRDRSLKQFKRAIGAGMMWIQSGKKELWVKTGNPKVRASIFGYLNVTIVLRRQPSKLRLMQKCPELESRLANLNRRKANALIKSEYSLAAMLDRWLEPLGRVKEPWKHPELIQKTAEFTAVSSKIAQLMIFYELAPQCQNKTRNERVMKVYSRFVTYLFRDLVAAYKDSKDSSEITSTTELSLLDHFERAIGFFATPKVG
ncbi:MAG: IS110 family transposase [Leptolyngbya sp. SIO4C5]|nr:IS110 family transposase [Leptolyngbya sp. SIO4C5]